MFIHVIYIHACILHIHTHPISNFTQYLFILWSPSSHHTHSSLNHVNNLACTVLPKYIYTNSQTHSKIHIHLNFFGVYFTNIGSYNTNFCVSYLSHLIYPGNLFKSLYSSNLSLYWLGSSPCGNIIGYSAIQLMGDCHSLCYQFICNNKQCYKTHPCVSVCVCVCMYPFNIGAFIPIR